MHGIDAGPYGAKSLRRCGDQQVSVAAEQSMDPISPVLLQREIAQTRIARVAFSASRHTDGTAGSRQGSPLLDHDEVPGLLVARRRSCHRRAKQFVTRWSGIGFDVNFLMLLREKIASIASMYLFPFGLRIVRFLKRTRPFLSHEVKA